VTAQPSVATTRDGLRCTATAPPLLVVGKSTRCQRPARPTSPGQRAQVGMERRRGATKRYQKVVRMATRKSSGHFHEKGTSAAAARAGTVLRLKFTADATAMPYVTTTVYGHSDNRPAKSRSRERRPPRRFRLAGPSTTWSPARSTRSLERPMGRFLRRYCHSHGQTPDRTGEDVEADAENIGFHLSCDQWVRRRIGLFPTKRHRTAPVP